jgi:hypothetical protein
MCSDVMTLNAYWGVRVHMAVRVRHLGSAPCRHAPTVCGTQRHRHVQPRLPPGGFRPSEALIPKGLPNDPQTLGATTGHEPPFVCQLSSSESSLTTRFRNR